MQKEHLILLAEKYLGGTATTTEQQQLHEWYDSWQDDEEQVLVSDDQTTDIIRERILARIRSEIVKDSVSVVPPVHRVHFLKTSWFRYAAAVVLLVGGGAIWWEFSRSLSSSPQTGITKDIAPGGDRAVLTLADGTKIILDDAANGNVAQQGGTKIIKLDNGQLAYSPLQRQPGDAKVGSGARGGLSKDLLYNTISTPRGGQYQITLPDGTKVWLNAASSIKFPTAFTGSTREVEMTGEAYMEIAKNSKQPFRVKANGTEIQVLGTSFNINAYSDEEAVKTTLVDGSVKVVRGDRESVLKPGQEAEVNNDGIKIRLAETDQILAWKNGLFNFQDKSLREVMRQLERWYDIKVEYQGAASDIVFQGKMYRNANLSDVLEMLKKMGVKFQVDGRRVIVL